MENKIKIHTAQIEQARKYEKNEKEKFKYKVSIENYNNEKKRYDGWKAVTVFSNTYHDIGDTIDFVWHNYNTYGRYEEIEENIPF